MNDARKTKATTILGSAQWFLRLSLAIRPTPAQRHRMVRCHDDLDVSSDPILDARFGQSLVHRRGPLNRLDRFVCCCGR